MIAELTQALLFAALTVPRPFGDTEPTEARAARLEVIAESIALESWSVEGWRWSTHDLAWLVFATTVEESGGFRLDVHAGARRGDSGRAACLGQLHAQALVPRSEWLASVGTSQEATRVCMRGVARVYAAASACAGSGPLTAYKVARMAASYGTGRTCRPDGLPFATRRGWLWAEHGRGWVGL
jgi:hypothetical protein